MSTCRHLGLSRSSIHPINPSPPPTHLFHRFPSTVAFPAEEGNTAQKLLVMNPQRRISTKAITGRSSSGWFHSGSSNTDYYLGNLVQLTPSYTLFNGKLQGREVSFFRLTHTKNRDCWVRDSECFISDHFLRVICVVEDREDSLVCTERVCPLLWYLSGRNWYELDNPYAFNSMFLGVLRGLIKLIADFESRGGHGNIQIQNLFWNGSRVVIIYGKDTRKGDGATGDIAHLRKVLQFLFGGKLPRMLCDLFICLLSQISVKYLLRNHHSLMSSETRISRRAFVVRNLLERRTRKDHFLLLNKLYQAHASGVFLAHRIDASIPPWKALLGKTYMGSSGKDIYTWKRQSECAVQYLITARNIAEHPPHDLGAGIIDRDLTCAFEAHESVMLMALHEYRPDLMYGEED